MADDDVQTGAAAFGPTGNRVGILSKNDSTRILRVAILGAICYPDEGYLLRQVIRRMMPFISLVDGIMLAELMEKEAKPTSADYAAWRDLAQALKDRT